MDSQEIYTILSLNQYTNKYFKGVFACDELLNIREMTHPSLLIVNTDISGNKGLHWICIFIPDSVDGKILYLIHP